MGSGDGYWKYIDIRQNETKELVGDTVIESVKCGTKGATATILTITPRNKDGTLSTDTEKIMMFSGIQAEDFGIIKAVMPYGCSISQSNNKGSYIVCYS